MYCTDIETLTAHDERSCLAALRQRGQIVRMRTDDVQPRRRQGSEWLDARSRRSDKESAMTTNHSDLIERLRALSRHEHSDTTIGDEAADALEAMRDAHIKERESLRMMLSDALSALEYHQEQTRPIHSTKVAIDMIRRGIA